MNTTTQKPDTQAVRIALTDPAVAEVFASMAETMAGMDKSMTHHHVLLMERNGELSYSHHVILVTREGDNATAAAEAIAATFWGEDMGEDSDEDFVPPTQGPNGYEVDFGTRAIRVSSVQTLDPLSAAIMSKFIYTKHIDEVAHLLSEEDSPAPSSRDRGR